MKRTAYNKIDDGVAEEIVLNWGKWKQRTQKGNLKGLKNISDTI